MHTGGFAGDVVSLHWVGGVLLAHGDTCWRGFGSASIEQHKVLFRQMLESDGRGGRHGVAAGLRAAALVLEVCMALVWGAPGAGLSSWTAHGQVLQAVMPQAQLTTSCTPCQDGKTSLFFFNFIFLMVTTENKIKFLFKVEG